MNSVLFIGYINGIVSDSTHVLSPEGMRNLFRLIYDLGIDTLWVGNGR